MINKFENAKVVFNQNEVIGRSITEVGDNELVHLSLGIGKTVPEHILEIDVTFFVITGNGTILIDGKKYKASMKDVIFVKSGSHRGWINDGETVLELFVVKKINKVP